MTHEEKSKKQESHKAPSSKPAHKEEKKDEKSHKASAPSSKPELPTLRKKLPVRLDKTEQHAPKAEPNRREAKAARKDKARQDTNKENVRPASLAEKPSKGKASANHKKPLSQAVEPAKKHDVRKSRGLRALHKQSINNR